MSERWQRLKAVFSAALDAPDDETRRRVVAEQCGVDRMLADEVRSLLAEHARVDGPLDRPAFLGGLALDAGSARVAASPAASAAASASISASASTFASTIPSAFGSGELTCDSFIGRRVGSYILQHRLGLGGMGDVYLATRADTTFEKQVAIKLVHPRRDTEAILRRFDQERRTLAALDHQNIARLIDAGSIDAGSIDGGSIDAAARGVPSLPYFVMEYVAGQRLDRHCDAHRLDIRARVRLFILVCDAVAYAHRNLVVHRDLKPDNIFASDEGVPKLLDFGIAKVLDPARGAPLTDPLVGVLRPLTLAYASPEQVLGDPITTAVDVYALGLLLFELLTGTRVSDG